MALNDAALMIAATAVRDSITHFQLHSSGTNPAANAVGARVATGAGTIDSDGDITWSNIAFTGLAANQAVSFVSYWSASTGGTARGGAMLSGDLAANAAGEITLTSVVENNVAS